MKRISPKTVKIKIDNEYYIHFWYANNKGNAKNCTVILSDCGIRSAKSKGQNAVIKKGKITAWKGAVRFNDVLKVLGLSPESVRLMEINGNEINIYLMEINGNEI